MTRGQGRVWSIQSAEMWGASEEALAFVTGRVGGEQAEREDERRRRMRPVLSEEDRKALEEAGEAPTLRAAMEKVTGVFAGTYEAMGQAVGAVREETLEWKKDLLAHMAATDRQNRKRHLEFSSPALKIPDGCSVTEEECLQQLSGITEEKYGIRLTWADVAACHPLGGKNGGRAIALFKNTNEGSPFARLLQPGQKEGGVRGLSSRVYLKVEVSTSSYDATIKEMVHWYKDHVGFMRKEARAKGMREDEAIPAAVAMTRYNHERLTGKLTVSIPGHRNKTITSARELLELIGQRCLDAFIMRVPATTWITPRRAEELPGPGYRGTGGNREPVGRNKAQERAGNERNREGQAEEQHQQQPQQEVQMEEGVEISRGEGEGDRESLVPSEISFEALQRSPRLEESGGEEAEEEDKRESTLLGRVTGLFRRSVQ